MSTLSFFIERHLKRTKYLIYVRYDHLGKKVMFSTNTKASLDQFNWVKENGRDKIKVNQPLNKTYLGYTRVNRDLIDCFMEVQEAMYEAKRHGDLSVHKVKEVYNELHFKSEVKTVIEGIDKVVELYGNSLSHRSLMNYDNNLRKHIEGFNKYHKKEFKLLELNGQFELEFKTYLTDVAKLNSSSIDNQIKYLKSLCSKLKNLGIDYNKMVETFKRSSIETKVVFLTSSELQKLYSSGVETDSLAKWKDLFVFQCFTGLRVGDLKRFNSSWVIENRIITRAEKTDRKITIPVLETARSILEKYNFEFGKIHEPVYNRAIHDILKELNFDRIIEEKESKPLWQVATSHTARKTFISYAHSQLKLSIADISLITGTSKDTILKYYVGSSIEDVENKIRTNVNA